MKKILIIALVLCLTKIASANNFYLNFDYGSDAANGSSTATAWKTWDKIRSYGVGSGYDPGDTISLLKGDSWTSATSYWSALGDGTVGNPIILGDWGTSTTRPQLITTGSLSLSFRNMSNWTIQNLYFDGSTDNLWASVYLNPDISNMSGIKILNCEITASSYVPNMHYLRVGEIGVQEIWDVEIGSCTVHGTATYSGNVDFLNIERAKSGVWIHDCLGYNGSGVGSLADIAGGDGHVFEYNKAYSVGNLTKFHSQQYAIENSVARYSLLYDSPSGMDNIGLILEEPRNCQAYNNTLYMGTNSVAAGQVWNDPADLVTWPPLENLVIQNNIFYGSRNGGGAFYIKDIDLETFKGSVTCNHNLYYKTNGRCIWNQINSVNIVEISNGSGSAAWQADHPGDLFIDPLFVDVAADDYHLAWNSPCIDAGIVVNATHTQSLDLDKNPIYGTPDIGAYEYQPPYIVGTDAIDITGTIRMYSNGKYRYKTGTTSGTLADMDIYHAAGRLSGTYSQWLDIEVTGWTAEAKTWTVTPAYGTNTRHVIGGLENFSNYAIVIDGATSTTKIANNNKIEFDYVIGASPVDFEVNLTADVEIAASGAGSVTCSGSGNIICQ